MTIIERDDFMRVAWHLDRPQFAAIAIELYNLALPFEADQIVPIFRLSRAAILIMKLHLWGSRELDFLGDPGDDPFDPLGGMGGGFGRGVPAEVIKLVEKKIPLRTEASSVSFDVPCPRRSAFQDEPLDAEIDKASRVE